MNDVHEVPLPQDVLLKAWEDVNLDVRTAYFQIERLIVIALALTAAVLAFKPDHPESRNWLYIALPLAGDGIFLYGTVLFYGIMASGAYRRFLEERINQTVGQPVLLADQIGTRFLRKASGVIGSIIICVVTLLGISLNSVSTASQNYPGRITRAVIAIDSALLLFCCISIFNCYFVYSRAYKYLVEAEKRDLLERKPGATGAASSH